MATKPWGRPAGTAGSLVEGGAAADGYTLLLAVDTHAANQSLFSNLSYDAVKDFAPVGLIGTVPMALVGGPALPAQSMQELVRLLKDKPGYYTYASIGVGSQTHLPARLLETAADVRMVHVPYGGGGPALQHPLAGHVSMMFASLTSAATLAQKSGVKLIAVAAPLRSTTFPSIPTMAEAGYPSVDMDMWFGIFAPAGTPEPIVARLNAAVNAALDDAEIKGRFAQLQITVTPRKPAEFAAFLDKDIAKRRELIRRENIQPIEAR